MSDVLDCRMTKVQSHCESEAGKSKIIHETKVGLEAPADILLDIQAMRLHSSQRRRQSDVADQLLSC